MNDSRRSQLYSGATPAQVASDLACLVDFQEEGVSLTDLEGMIASSLLPHLMRYDRPQFQSMFNAVPPVEAQIGAQVAMVFNQGVTNWQVSPGGAMLEELCGQALCRLFRLGPNADATFMYSGTYGNHQALYMALHRHAERHGFDLAIKGIAGFAAPEKLAILVSQDGHFSLKHAVRLLGLGENCLVQLPLDTNYRVDAAAMGQIVQDVAARREIVAMVATAGTTSTGAVDPIEPFVELCQQNGAWLHVDGAYGYAYKLVPEWSDLFRGDANADSIAWDPHKQLGAPIPNSVLFVKERSDFNRMSLHSHYFNRPGETEPNPGLKSPPSTRPMSVLPLVSILRGQGLRRVVEGLRAPLLAIRELASYLRDLPDVELCHLPDTGILCFRLAPHGAAEGTLDLLQQKLYSQIMKAGERTISTTRLEGRQVLRLVTVNPDTNFQHLRDSVDWLRRAWESGEMA